MRIVQVDAFTHRPFRGNPAAVCVMSHAAGEGWMRNVAAEMNLSETAFCYPEGEGFRLRWFTPAAEVDLCGHATLAAAHVLWDEGHVPREAAIAFETRSGTLRCVAREGWIVMDFPAEPVVTVALTNEESARFAVPARFTGRNRMDLLVELADADAVTGYTPDLTQLARFTDRGVIVTARAEPGSGHDFVSRFFAPRFGVPEDPVTGSAHCALGPYWAERLGRAELVGFQASRRGGLVRVKVSGQRVELSGQAVTIMEGRLLAGPDGESA